ncbi:hypothetical protein GGQ73_001261 [Rhizobium skierniewicense]|uniref:Uncharacterized protein n=1 Tax=Rhizobium skierniewicense TaxID=984260 RepID=A0A7W6C7D3_9HYPH|nr:hypothetical protein [Rhizobium skierniewicense]MBB3945328.1 hypothetical protein [Rhizobium skierniewicense]
MIAYSDGGLVGATDKVVAVPIADDRLICNKHFLANRDFATAGYPALAIAKSTSQRQFCTALNANRAAAIGMKLSSEMQFTPLFYNKLGRLWNKTLPCLTQGKIATAGDRPFDVGLPFLHQRDGFVCS